MKARFPNPNRFVLLAGLIFLLLAVSIALAAGVQSQPRSLVSAGGSQASSGSLSLSSALGQPLAGVVGSGDITAASGFWVGAGVPSQPPVDTGMNLYLPIVVR